jgi:hypothetical protein
MKSGVFVDNRAQSTNFDEIEVFRQRFFVSLYSQDPVNRIFPLEI